jgi:hypothetical protein
MFIKALMLGETLLLQTLGYFGGGTFGNLLFRLEQLGFFSYLLPFLIIFALVFGILTKIKIFEDNKPVNAIIALSVGLMALQFGFVSNYFAELFPRLGVGLSIILAIMIAAGLFMDPDNKAINYGLLGISVIIIIVILSQTADASYWWYSGLWWSNNLGSVLAIGIFLAALAIVVGGITKPKDDYKGFVFR